MNKHWNLLAGAAVALTASAATAGEMSYTTASGSAGKQTIANLGDAATFEESSLLDNLWALPTLYKGDGAILQEFGLIGRYHGTYYDVDGDDQGSDDGWDNRRQRLGFSAALFNQLDLEVQFNVDYAQESDRFFKNIEDVAIEWSGIEGLGLAIGKFKPTVSREYNTSSKRIKTIERSLFVNQVVPEKVWGASTDVEVGGLDVQVGAFAGDLDGDWDFSEFNAGYLLNAAVDFGDVRLSYLYNDGNEGNTGAEDYDNIVSLSYVNYGKKGYEGLGLFAEAMYADGDSSGYGITLMPSYMITDQLEAVVRVHHAGSDESDGLTVQKRYDRKVSDLSSKVGDQYIGVYGGLNYYINGDKLKLMGGVEVGSFDQDNGDSLDVVSLMAGVRIYF